MLSDRERRKLADIERQMAADDPKFVRRFESLTTADTSGDRRKIPASQRVGNMLGSLALLMGAPWSSWLSPRPWHWPGTSDPPR